MPKKIAVLVRDRQAEALRMAVGLAIQHDKVDAFIMDQELDVDDPVIALNLEMLSELSVRVGSNNARNRFEFLTTEEIATALVQYDSVIPY